MCSVPVRCGVTCPPDQLQAISPLLVGPLPTNVCPPKSKPSSVIFTELCVVISFTRCEPTLCQSWLAVFFSTETLTSLILCAGVVAEADGVGVMFVVRRADLAAVAGRPHGRAVDVVVDPHAGAQPLDVVQVQRAVDDRRDLSRPGCASARPPMRWVRRRRRSCRRSRNPVAVIFTDWLPM